MTLQGISLNVVKSRVLRDVPQGVLYYAPFYYSHYVSLRTPTYKLHPMGFTTDGVGATCPNTLHFVKESSSTWIASFYFDQSVLRGHLSTKRGLMSSLIRILVATTNASSTIISLRFQTISKLA